MVGHQHERIYDAVVLERGFAQFLQVLAVIDIGSEACLPIVAALYDLFWDAGQIELWQSGRSGLR
jgi:hypothetical protein